MAIKTTYLAAQNSASERRSRALHRFTAASPILLLLAVGTVGHLRQPPRALPAGMAEYDRKVLAYKDRVAAANALADRTSLRSADRFEAEGRRWRDGLQDGTLTAIHPAYFEDHLREGPRGEILHAGVFIVDRLCLFAERRIQKGQVQEGERSAIMAAQIAHGLRGFEVQAMLQTLLEQRRALGIVAKAWPKLDLAERASVRSELQGLTVDPGEPVRLRKMEDEQAAEYAGRQKVEAAKSQSFGYGWPSPEIQQDETTARSVAMVNDRIESLLGRPRSVVAEKGLPQPKQG